MLVRADGAGCSKAFLAHVRGLREQAVLTEFTVGWAVTDRERTAVAALSPRAWTPAVDADGRHRAGAHVAELTGLLPAGILADYPPGTRILVRRERPHPGAAQLDAFEHCDGWRYQCLATDTGVGQLAFLGARHRPRPRRRPHQMRQGHRPRPLPQPAVRRQRLADHRHARRRSHRLGPDDPPARRPGPGPSRAEDAALPAATRRRQPVRGGRRLRLGLDQHWPWAAALARAFARCAALPQPAR